MLNINIHGFCYSKKKAAESTSVYIYIYIYICIYRHVNLVTRLSPFSFSQVCEGRAWEQGYNQYPDILEEMLYSSIILAFIQNNVPTSVHCIKCTLCACFCNVGKTIVAACLCDTT